MIRVIGGQNCQRLSAYWQHQRQRQDSALIFSINSDDRIPLEAERLLGERTYRFSNILVVGDLAGLELEHWRVRDFLIELLANHAFWKHATLFWFDGDLMTSKGIENSLIKFEGVIELHKKITDTKQSIPLPSCQLFSELCEILSCIPGHTLNGKNEVESICFNSPRIYPRSLLNSVNVQKRKKINNILQQMNGLKKLDFSFTENLTLPLVNGARYLNLRGCENACLKNLTACRDLFFLNITACKLSHLPQGLEELSKLEVLIAAKNRIGSLDSFELPASLIRLSLYRNNLKDLKLNFDHFDKLISLNLGANPLKRLRTPGGQSTIDISLRKVNYLALVLETENHEFLRFSFT